MTGGIEKVSRIAGKALCELASENGDESYVYSMYDKDEELDEKYFPRKYFAGFNNKKVSFIYKSIQQGRKSRVVFLSHINLLLVGYLIKLVSPKTKIVLLVHGIEVWVSFKGFKRKMLASCDRILAVSYFTRNTIIELNNLPESQFTVLNNCLDPFLDPPVASGKNEVLLQRYGIRPGDIVLMALTRISSKEKYKGYDRVLEAMRVLRKKYPTIKYLLVGKYDDEEKKRLDQIVKIFGLNDAIIFAGFIPDKELADHYNLADVYVMPSEKEGFGIVFIEAMYYGKPVIAGNMDGSVDALSNGELGLLVNPYSQTEVVDAITKVLSNKSAYMPNAELLNAKFSYNVYKQKLNVITEQLN